VGDGKGAVVMRGGEDGVASKAKVKAIWVVQS